MEHIKETLVRLLDEAHAGIVDTYSKLYFFVQEITTENVSFRNTSDTTKCTCGCHLTFGYWIDNSNTKWCTTACALKGIQEKRLVDMEALDRALGGQS